MYKCPHCTKEYKKPGVFKRHKALCELLAQSKDETRIDLEDLDTIPSQLDMFRMLQELSRKYTKLENTVKQLNSQREIKKIKIKTIDWLNKHKTDQILFSDFVSNIEITEEIIDSIAHTALPEIITQLITEYILNYSTDNTNNLPCYSNNNIIYIYNDNTWSIASHENIVDVIKVIEKKILQKFNEIKLKYEMEISTSIMMKLFNIQQTMYTQVRKHINTSIPLDTTSISDYELTL